MGMQSTKRVGNLPGRCRGRGRLAGPLALLGGGLALVIVAQVAMRALAHLHLHSLAAERAARAAEETHGQVRVHRGRHGSKGAYQNSDGSGVGPRGEQDIPEQ